MEDERRRRLGGRLERLERDLDDDKLRRDRIVRAVSGGAQNANPVVGRKRLGRARMGDDGDLEKSEIENSRGGDEFSPTEGVRPDADPEGPPHLFQNPAWPRAGARGCYHVT